MIYQSSVHYQTTKTNSIITSTHNHKLKNEQNKNIRQFQLTNSLSDEAINVKQFEPQFAEEFQNDNILKTPGKKSKQRIFMETPQAIFIPLPSQNIQNSYTQDLINNPTQISGLGFIQNTSNRKKLTIFDGNIDRSNEKPSNDNHDKNKTTQRTNKTSNSKHSMLEQSFKKPKNSGQQVIKSKNCISFHKQRISQLFYYQSYVICKGINKVLIYNFLNKSITEIPIEHDYFILTTFAPYIFNCIIGQFLHLYSQDLIDKLRDLQRKKAPKQEQLRSIEGSKIIIKISKMEVLTIYKYNQGYFMGGYNRSVLPGGKKSQRRQIYFMDHLDPKINNKPKQIIKLSPSKQPVSLLWVQMPYLIAYCRPYFYFFGLKSHDLLLTFQKQLKSSILLEGRYAMNVMNGIGISNKESNKQNIFTFDIENSPIFGVQITQHKQQASCLCLEKTGRIFGCNKSAIFEYVPSKRITRCVKLYAQSEIIVWIQCTPNNNLLALRQTANSDYVIEAFSIDESTLNEY